MAGFLSPAALLRPSMRTAVASAFYVALQAIGSYGFAVLSVQMLERSQLNHWVVWEGWSLMLLPFATGGQEYNLIKKFASTERSSSIAVNGAICLSALVSTIGIFAFIRPHDWGMIGLLLSSEVAMAIALTILRGKEQYWPMVWLVGARWALAIGLVMAVRNQRQIDAHTLIYSRFLPVLPVMAYLLWGLWNGLRAHRARLPWADLVEETKYAMPLIAVALLNGGILGLPRVVLEREGAASALRDLFVAQKVGMVFDLLFSRPLGIIWPQIRFKIHERRTELRLGRAYGWAVLASGLMMPVFLLLSRFVLFPIFGVSQADTGMVMQLLMCNAAIIFINTATMLSNVSLYSTGNTVYMLYAGLAAMALGGAAILVLPHIWGVIAINCLMVAVNLVNFIFIVIFSSRKHAWSSHMSEARLAMVGLVIFAACAILVGSYA